MIPATPTGPSGNLVLDDDTVGRILFTGAQAQVLLQRRLPDVEPADLEPFLSDLFADRVVLGLDDILEAYFSDQPVAFRPV